MSHVVHSAGNRNARGMGFRDWAVVVYKMMGRRVVNVEMREPEKRISIEMPGVDKAVSEAPRRANVEATPKIRV